MTPPSPEKLDAQTAANAQLGLSQLRASLLRFRSGWRATMRWTPEQHKRRFTPRNANPAGAGTAGASRLHTEQQINCTAQRMPVASRAQSEQHINCPLCGQHRTTNQLPDFAGWAAELGWLGG